MGSHDASASRRLVVSSPGARPRSASVGDTTLLFKSSSSPNFEPINEEEPSPEEEELQCGAARSFDFADMPCWCNDNGSRHRVIISPFSN